ncbi:MAG: RagB/SusD family nutrient uptake outer membrane protein [Tannerella sp.]|nr:RagB/SusD family nutrient uptake outer membrane protein [Tannerella sp.]
MKTLLKYILILCFLSGIASCEDFLREDNRSNIDSDSYFAEATAYESLVSASYSTLRSVWRADPWLFCLGVDIYTRGESELRSGSYENRDVYSRQLNEYNDLNSTNSFVSDFYAAVYKAIQTCNTAIARAEKVTGLTDARKEQLVAEVKFLRAYYYYLLAEQFGGVPLVLDEINTAITHFERDTEEDVFRFIISELEATVGILPETPEQFGRVTKGAVKNLLSLVYLTRGYKSYAGSSDFSLAASYADEVINSGQYSLLSSFEEVFAPGNEENKEIIFSIQYDAGSLSSYTSGNGQNVHFGWELWTKVLGGFERGNTTYNWKKSQFTPTQFLYSLFDTEADSRYDVTFLSTFYATADDVSTGVRKGDLRTYFPKYDQPFTVQDSLDFMAQHPNAIIITKSRWIQDIEGLGGTGMVPMVWKFYDPDAPFPDNNTGYTSTRDIFLFRLAETYLIAAEAYHKLNNNDKAVERINSVRQRAAIPGNEAAMTIPASDVTLDFILDERARELTGEYKRWMDLKRTGKLIERTLLYNNLAQRTNRMEPHHLLRPIPQTVRDQDSGDFPQNPGYN